MLFGTGEGQTFPAGRDGVLTGAETALPVRVTIGGKEGLVLYAGGGGGIASGGIVEQRGGDVAIGRLTEHTFSRMAHEGGNPKL